MSSSLSNLADNLSDRRHNDTCTDCKSYLGYMSIKNNQLIFRCFNCKKSYKKDVNKKLINRFENIFEFCNGDINNFFVVKKRFVSL